MSKKILKKGSANYFSGLESIGGELTLTNSDLIFESHDHNLQTGHISISLKAILSINKSWFPTTFSIVTVDGLKHKFVVSGRNGWTNEINKKINGLKKSTIKNKDLNYNVGFNKYNADIKSFLKLIPLLLILFLIFNILPFDDLSKILLAIIIIFMAWVISTHNRDDFKEIMDEHERQMEENERQMEEIKKMENEFFKNR